MGTIKIPAAEVLKKIYGETEAVSYTHLVTHSVYILETSDRRFLRPLSLIHICFLKKYGKASSCETKGKSESNERDHASEIGHSPGVLDIHSKFFQSQEMRGEGGCICGDKCR